MYCFEYNNKLLFYQVGYDPKWLKLSALKILIFNCIEHSINSKLDEFDFGRGTDDYKFKWTKTVRETNDLLIFRRNFIAKLFLFQKNVYMIIKKILS